MNRAPIILSLFTLLFACAVETPQRSPQTAQTPAVAQPKSSEVVKQFFAAFGRGDLDGIAASFAPDATLIAVHSGVRREGELYGTYSGTAGVREFIMNLGKTFDTKSFSVDTIASEGDIVFAKGSFAHIVRRSGKTFQSDWSLLCRVNGGRITEYRFFEDSAAFIAADAKVARAAEATSAPDQK